VVLTGEFSSIPVTRRRRAEESRRAFAPKNGQKPKPSRWPAYTLQLTGKGETIPRDGVSKPGAGQCGKTRGKNGAAICREAFNDAPSYRIAETPFG